MKVLLMTFNSSYIHPNLALRLLYVARDKRHDVKIMEFTIKDDINRVKEKIEEYGPDVIGLSTYIWNVDITKDFIKLINPDNKYRILLGGPEVSYESDEWLDLNIEAVLRGEGEITFWQAVNKEENIDGYYSKDYKSDVKYAHVPIEYLESLESPYFLDIDNDTRANRYLYIETSRGCPYRCTYCLSSLENRIRDFSLDYVFKELKKLEKYKVKQVKFLDRTFNSNPKRALEIAKFINDLDVDVSFQFEVALEFFNDELLNFFINAKKDRFRFEVGVQTFNQETLKAIRRAQNEEKLVRNIKMFADNDIVMHTDLIAGLPFEGYESFKNSFYKLFKLHTSEIQMGILKLLKGTKMKEDVVINETVYSHITPYEVISTKWITKEEMDKIKLVAHIIDKTYNNGRLRYTFDTLYELGFDIFEIMAQMGQILNEYKDVQLISYFEALNKALNDDKYKYLLLNDYYKLFKQRPKALFERPSQEIRNEVFTNLIAKGYDEHMLYQYSLLDYAIVDNKLMYQLVIYNKEQKLPKIEYLEI